MDTHPGMAAAARRIPEKRLTPEAAARAEATKKRIRENIVRNVLRLRTEAGLTQRQLSELADVSQTYLWQIEKQAPRNLSIDLVVGLAVALGTTLEDLISDD